MCLILHAEVAPFCSGYGLGILSWFPGKVSEFIDRPMFIFFGLTSFWNPFKSVKIVELFHFYLCLIFAYLLLMIHGHASYNHHT